MVKMKLIKKGLKKDKAERQGKQDYFDEKESEMFDRRSFGPSATEILDLVLKRCGAEEMLPPEPDYSCKKCGQAGYLSEWEKSEIEYGGSVKCPNCGGDLRIHVLTEKI